MNNLKKAYFAGGCFWCTEAVFLRLKGVKKAIPGYSGGNYENPTYEQVCSGITGHAETVLIEYDSDFISYEMLLDVFFRTHDPTTINRQGNDVGIQYRSVIFYHNEDQKEIAEWSKQDADKSKYWSNPIVTEITNLNNYSDAEDYHDNYYDNNPNQPYCLFVIRPKLNKLQKDGVFE